MADSTEGLILEVMLEIMKKEVNTLKSYIEHELNSALEFSWTPTVYERTGKTMESIYISQEPTIVGNSIVAGIGFIDNLVMHDSYMGDGQPKGNTSWLLEVGWDISDKTGLHRAFFDVHPGYHYLEKAITRFNQNNEHGIQVNVYIDDAKYI